MGNLSSIPNIVLESFRSPLKQTDIVQKDDSKISLKASSIYKDKTFNTHSTQGNRNISLPPTFKVAFIAVSVATVLAFITNLYIAFTYPELTEAQNNVLSICENIVTTGFGAIVGLLGGKAA
ncbi:hypothetical protein [uncultured Methanolobus sp.]|jgi:hypothetical protein|uniref:hypothetical protein n=1 Tax=uncultured Methanolobus sp. TaxID=218300 RepID=UPI002AAC1430|nr:hypothetical protein [uncultured Methanolobus sp.]